MKHLERSDIAAEAVRRFAACAISIGYCIDTQKTEMADTFGRELRPLVLLMADDELGRMNQLCTLMNTVDDPWVKYHAASFLYFDYGREDARRVLGELAKGPGLVAPLAQVMLVASGSKDWFLK